MKLNQISNAIESLAPLSLQENYDNSGLIVGLPKMEITKAIISFDVTEKVVEEAKSVGANLIISHHPIIFGSIKKLNANNYVERIVMQAVKNDIALYAVHTNLDNVIEGTNRILARKLNLENLKVLQGKENQLFKLVVYVPLSHLVEVRTAIFQAGAGNIGNYDQCSYSTQGKGSFRAGEGAKPFVGNIDELHIEDEYRLETVFPSHRKNAVMQAMTNAHPYEEVAYDIFALEKKDNNIGAGVIGTLKEEVTETEFFAKLKEITKAKCIRHSALRNKPIKKIAICGGSGAFLIKNAMHSKADIYITGDVKYHEFFDAEDKMIIADIGHFESEQFTTKLLYDFLKEKFPTFAVQISDIYTSPINYL